MDKTTLEGIALELDTILDKWDGDPHDALDDVKELRDRVKFLLDNDPANQ